jgi:predicted RND superfamily exporter protein
MAWTVPATRPGVVLAVAAFATLMGAWQAANLQPEVDFLDTVPADEPGLDAYRALIERLDGVRFVAVHMPADPLGHGLGDLRTDGGFDALVSDQQALTDHLVGLHPAGTFTHSLSVYEAMRAGNYMLQKVATSGNPPDSAYALPGDPVSWSYVRDEVRGDSGKDVLAADGSSALLLLFIATADPAEARGLAATVADEVGRWGREHPESQQATHQPQASGLLVASAYTDERNAHDLRVWGLASMAAAAVALLIVVRRPGNLLIALLSIACATTWTFGVLGAMGAPISFLTVFLAPLLAGVGVDYAVHLLQRYEEERDSGAAKRAAVATAIATSGGAAAVSAATTALGLLALLLVPAPLFAQVGAVAALGVAFGFLASVTVVPALRAVLPERRGTSRRRKRRSIARVVGMASARHPVLALAALALVTAAAVFGAATQTRVESGSAENEFPQDDPMILLQHRIEDEYGAFQRAYLVVQGDLSQPAALQALHAATVDAAALPLYRDASAVTDLLIADDATDQGAVDFTLTGLLSPTPAAIEDEDRLPATPQEARQDLDRLFADPLWRGIAPFTITRDYTLAVVAIRLEPWQDQAQLIALRDALRGQAQDLQARLGPSYDVQAAGAPVNRAAVLEQTPADVAIATVGVALVVAATLAVTWSRRGWPGLRAAALCVLVVLVAAAWLLATVPLLDLAYRLAEAWGAPANRAALTDMFLLAFAITVAAGLDNLVHLVHRHWESRSAGLAGDAALEDALDHGGRAITGTSLTTVLAFAVLAGVYFLQSKNLAILAALGVLYAWALTLLVGPWILKASVKEQGTS